jgi:hypothetical protein
MAKRDWVHRQARVNSPMGVVDLAKSTRRSDMKACHTMDQGSTNKDVDEMMKLTIGFKDNEMMNVHKFVKQETTR